VLGTSLTPVYAALATRERTLGTPAPQKARKAPKATNKEAESVNPSPVSRGRGSHVKPMVERTVRWANPVIVRAQALSLA
jgi:hypothetical protein